MGKYQEGLRIIEEKCGNNKDNVISLATISRDLNENGKPIPSVRDVDAYYEDGVFYVVTYGLSNKMLEIADNDEIAFSVNFENVSGKAKAINLGWVLDPKNAEIRTKLRNVFAAWYDEANDENDVNFCFLAIQIKKAIVVTGHGPTTQKYYMDFVNKRIFDDVKEMKKRDALYLTFDGRDAINEGRDYIFKLLAENNIDLEKNEGPIYIFGEYDLEKQNQDDLLYTLYFIFPKNVKLTNKTLKKKVFGGFFARRTINYQNIETESFDLYETFKNSDNYKAKSSSIIEQYLLATNSFTNDTEVMIILPLIKKHEN